MKNSGWNCSSPAPLRLYASYSSTAIYHQINLVPFPFGSSLTVHMNGSVMSIWVRASSGTSGGSFGAHALVGIVTGSSRHWRPVSSATSRKAASFRDSPMFRRPFGSNHSFVLRRLTRQTLAFAGFDEMNRTAPQLSTNCSDAYCRVTKFDSAMLRWSVLMVFAYSCGTSPHRVSTFSLLVGQYMSLLGFQGLDKKTIIPEWKTRSYVKYYLRLFPVPTKTNDITLQERVLTLHDGILPRTPMISSSVPRTSVRRTSP